MYQFLLSSHSIIRWLVLLALLISTFKAYQGWINHKRFTILDQRLFKLTTSIVYLQFTFGVLLYSLSPIVKHFWFHLPSSIQMREIRFFGMEHITIMVISVSLISIGEAKLKKSDLDIEKFKIIAIFFTIALLLILSSIPWSFSPLTSRPLWR